MSFTFDALALNSTRRSSSPDDDEVWFINFGRSEQTLNVSDSNTYVKARGVPTDWWSWQPCGAINLHLQDRWGLMQFKKDSGGSFNFDRWHIYRALFDTMNAEKKHKVLNAKYTDNLAELDLPPYLMSGVCVDLPTIELTQRDGQQDFFATVKSKLLQNITAHIRSDRYVTFGWEVDLGWIKVCWTHDAYMYQPFLRKCYVLTCYDFRRDCILRLFNYYMLYNCEYNWAASSDLGTYRLCEQQRFRRACASAQSRKNLRCSLIQAVSLEEPSDRKPDPWPFWMAGHAQLKFVMTECSKTQIRLTGLIFSSKSRCFGCLKIFPFREDLRIVMMPVEGYWKVWDTLWRQCEYEDQNYLHSVRLLIKQLLPISTSNVACKWCTEYIALAYQTPNL